MLPRLFNLTRYTIFVKKIVVLDNLTTRIEALIFAAEKPVSLEEIRDTLTSFFGVEFDERDVLHSVERLMTKYHDEEYAMELIEISGGFRFMTKAIHHELLSAFLKTQAHKKLSKAGMETLAIIAYKQPVTKSEIESIRGVNSDYSVQKLLDLELIEISGRSEGPGKALLFSTSDKFMDYLGLKSITDLPKLKEFEAPQNTIGEPATDDVMM